jgi:hypothetical protein
MQRRKRRGGRERRIAGNARPTYPKIMIVCEGEKTEPSYLGSLLQALRLPSAEIVIYGRECGSSPATLVNFALRKFDEFKSTELVYCVFDRDSHPDYEASRQRCSQLKRTTSNGATCQFLAITSEPCFEFWLLLHFIDSDAPIVGKGQRSSGQVALSRLKKHFPEYSKGAGEVFSRLRDRLPVACERALRINSRSAGNPHTKVVDLVGALTALRPNDSSFSDVRARLPLKMDEM